jgi:hypothetical protein
MRATAISVLSYRIDCGTPPKNANARIWPSQKASVVSAGYVQRDSTSSGLYNAETGERYPSSGGQHLYLLTANGGDARRFLYALHARAWIAGLGWHVVSKCGSLLERSIIDKMVCAGERLVFEGDPMLVAPLAQERCPATVHPGAPLDMLTTCPDLSAAEEQEFKRLKATSAQALAKERARVRAAWLEARIAKAVAAGIDPKRARRMAEQQLDGVLLPTATLVFDDPEIGTKSVAAVLANADEFINATLADPMATALDDGEPYERNKAAVQRDAVTGDVFIYSFAHGGVTYTLRHDRETIEAAVDAADKADVARLF